MPYELLPNEVGDGAVSLEGFIYSGDFTTFHLIGTVTTTAIVIQHLVAPGVWRDLVESAATRQLDVDDSAIRMRGPLRIRVVRRGTEACGCSASNWCGDGTTL